MKRIIIIGGGVAGLSAAHRLQQLADESGEDLDLALLESAGYWGGKILTERVNGFVIEGGPDTFLATKPWGVSLCRELGLEERLHGANPAQRKTYVLNRGRLQPLPDGLALMIPARFSSMARTPLLSPLAKARLGLDYFLPPRSLDGDESLGAFVSRRLGRPAYERLIEPLMSGIYAGDGDQLSLQATFPYLRDLELKHGGLLRGALAARRQASQNGKSAPGSPSAFLTPTSGLAEIVEALVARLAAGEADLRLNSPVTSLTRRGPGYRVALAGGESLEAEGIILAAPAYTSGDLLADLDPTLAAELRAIPYTSTATVSLAYPLDQVPRPLDGYGYVIPRGEGRRALACTWTSTKFPHRAPPGYALLRVFIGRAGQSFPWEEDRLLELARDELRQTLGITAAPFLWRVFRWEKAMPQYNLGHPERLARLEIALERHPGLALAGNGYRGLGLPDCIHSGQQAAEKNWKATLINADYR
jgi:oxygen-dependent protoporphyrinogen oxidase